MQQHVFESYAEIQSCRLLTLHAARGIDRGDQARVEIGDDQGRRRPDAAQRRSTAPSRSTAPPGLTDDTPLSTMYRAARFARIYDGPDEVHIHTVARRLLKEFRDGTGLDFAGPTS